MRSGPGAARTIPLFHTISARPSKEPRMVRSTLGVYSFGLIFVSTRTKDIIIIVSSEEPGEDWVAPTASLNGMR